MATYDYSQYSKVKSPTGYDIYQGTNKLSYEQAKPMFASGFNVDHIKEGSAPQVASQPAPGTSSPSTNLTGMYKAATDSVGPDGKPIYDVFAGGQHISNPNDPRLAGVNIQNLQTGSAPEGFQSKFQKGFNQATSAGVQDGNAGVVEQFSPAAKNDVVSAFVKQDEFIGGLQQKVLEYFQPENQRASLSDTYNTMLKESGIQAIDMELVNTKNIIEGSEDDIRNEITKAGGFATDSQVMALTNARNKQLIKNYNNLLDTRNAKERYLQTAIGLEQADRESADKRFESAFSMTTQLATLHQQMQTNARSQMQWLATNIGFDGLYQASGGDPHAMSLIERSLGMPQGGLASSAQQAFSQRQQALQKSQLEMAGSAADLQYRQGQIAMQPLDAQLKQSQILTEQAQRAKIANDINTSGINADPGQLLAYAQQYASTGTIPTGLPKGTFGIVAEAAKVLPKSPGQILDKATGVTPDKLGAAGDAYGALYSAIELSKQLQEMDKSRWGGVVSGTLGKVFGSDSQQSYIDLRAQIVDLLARARSGAALTITEEKRYADMLPGRFSNTLGFGASTETRINNFLTTLTGDLINKTNSKGWVVNGLSTVQIGDQMYKVGDTVQNAQGQQGRILPDGSVYLIQ